MSKIYYVIMSAGVPVDVCEIWGQAVDRRNEWDSQARPASVLPVMSSNKEWRPGETIQMEFDFTPLMSPPQPYKDVSDLPPDDGRVYIQTDQGWVELLPEE